jgi:hypothetical protein
MAYILTKKNILVTLGEVKQTVRTPILIAILVNTANTLAAVKDRCLDQYESCLMKIFYKL